MPKPIRVLFAPDYRDGGDYQSLLADALAAVDVEVAFMSDYRQGLPLARGVRDFPADALHLHWPEKYFQRRRDGLDWLRKLRYPLDRALATSRLPLFATAHNLLPHDRGDEFGVFTCVRDTMRSAHAVFTHSEAARAEVQTMFGLPDDRCVNIPHGDLAAGWPALLPRAQARTALGLTDDKALCLMFGTVSPYKGIAEVVRHFAARKSPARLVVVGRAWDNHFARDLRDMARESDAVDLRIAAEWLSRENLHCWLSAADVTLFNYRTILTSGAACLARSLGVPVVIPHRLSTVDLAEPHPLVFRFRSLEEDFDEVLTHALSAQADYASAAEWRQTTSWHAIAEITAATYRAHLATKVH